MRTSLGLETREKKEEDLECVQLGFWIDTPQDMTITRAERKAAEARFKEQMKG